MSNNIIIELCELSRNMNWLDGLHWFDICMVVGSNLGRIKVNFIFAKILFGMEWKGHRNPSKLAN